MSISILEKTLWEIYQFSVFNYEAVNAALASVDFILDDSKRLIYLVDFSDIHPVMYPASKKHVYDEEMIVHGKSVQMIWEQIQKQDKAIKKFHLTLSPASRLEVFESLRHCRCRLNRFVKEFIPDNLMDFSLNKLAEHIEKKYKGRHFTEILDTIIGNRGIDDGIRRPAQRLLSLFRNGLLHTLEDVITEDVVHSRLVKNVESNKLEQELNIFFKRNPRYQPTNVDHDKFHDAVDVINLCLTFDLYRFFDSEKKVFTPFITHTERVLAAGRSIFFNKREIFIVHRSVAPLYLAVALNHVGEANLKEYLIMCLTTLDFLKKDIHQCSIIRELSKLRKRERENRFEKENYANIPKRIMDNFSVIWERLYSLVDNPFDEDFKNGKIDNRTHEQITINNIKDILNRVENAENAAKQVVKKVKRYMDSDFTSGLAELYSPSCQYARDLTDWIDECG